MIKIFCEGIGDQIFISNFIEFHFEIKFEKIKNDNKITIKNEIIEIIPIEGCTKIHEDYIKNQFINNSESGGINLLIFDADYKNVNGNNGYEACMHKLENLKNHVDNPIIFESFIWPNNSSDGFFEDLLINLIPDDKKEVLDCIMNNRKCISSINKALEVNIPSEKELINYYLYILKQSTKNIDKTYLNEFWCLEKDKYAGIESLYHFFEEYLKHVLVES